MQEIKERLTQFRLNLEPHEIEWKAQPSKGKGFTTLLPYIDNRAVMNRLDSIFGAGHWQTEFRAFMGGAVCKLSIKIGDEWVSKEDVASPSNIEPDKGAASGAMKRAASQWGLGRELYDYPTITINGENWYIPNEVLPRLAKMTEEFNKGTKLSDKYSL